MRERSSRPRSASRTKAPAIRRAGVCVAMAGMVSACSMFGSSNQSSEQSVLPLFGTGSRMLSGYVGNVVADEPQAALAAQTVLQRGGNAADAAAALGLALSVTLPSRASLGAGGACLAWRPEDRNDGQAFLFLPTGDSPADRVQGPVRHPDRPASAPMFARGLYVMQMRYGSVDFADITQPALRLARGGIEVGSQLASDLATVQAPLLADEGARAIFSRPDGSAMKAGDILMQPRLAGSLERLRSAGVGDLYIGALAQTFLAGSDAAGAGLTADGLRKALPVTASPLRVSLQGRDIAFLPPPADGGYGMAVAWKALENGGSVSNHTGARAIAGWRASESGGQVSALTARAQHLLTSGSVPSGGSLPALPASTSFAVADRQGEVVACAVTMNNLFGTGRVAGSTGIVLAASAAHAPRSILPAAIAHHNQTFLAAATASGQADAADEAASAFAGALRGEADDLKPVTQAGRANAISCAAGREHCFGYVDPRSSGYASGSSSK